MSNSAKQFIGGVMMIAAALWMIADGQGFSFGGLFPPQTTKSAYFILLTEDVANPDPGVVEVINSEQWVNLSNYGIEVLQYDITPDDRKPKQLEEYVTALGGLSTPAILVLDKERNNAKMMAVPMVKSVEELEALVKRVTGQ